MCQLLVLTISFSLFGFFKLANGESGLLVLARAGGRYDPFDLLQGKPEELWGVNQCILDEQEGFLNHTIKGNFRSPRVDNLTAYEEVKLELVVFNKFGEELMTLKDCHMKIKQRYMNCTDSENTPVMVNGLDGMGGLLATRASAVLVAMFDRRFYFDNEKKRETILMKHPGKHLRRIDTGYSGCFRTDKNLKRSERLVLNQPTVEACTSSCGVTSFAGILQEKGRAQCSCFPKQKSILASLGERVSEDECSELCESNMNQTCGGANATVAFDVTKYDLFKRIVKGAHRTQEIGLFTFEGNLTQTYVLKLKSVVKEVHVDEEEECKLTNSFFNVSSPKYKLTLSADLQCAGNVQSNSRVVSSRTEPWHLGFHTSGCVILEPLPHNCTYHMATFKFYGYPVSKKSATAATADTTDRTDMVEISPGYIGIRGEWFLEAQQKPDEPASTSTNSTPTSEQDSTKTDNDTETLPDTVTNEDSDSIAVTASGTVTNDSSEDDELGATTMDSASLDAMTTNGFPTDMMQQNSTYETTGETTGANTDSTSTTSTTFQGSRSTGTTVADFVSNITTPIPAVRQACTCVCKQKPLAQNQTKVMAAKEKAIKIQKKLKIDTMNLSSSVRKKVSAPDTRTTAAVGGYLGIVLLTISLGSLILADLTSIGRHIRFFRNRKPANPTKKCK